MNIAVYDLYNGNPAVRYYKDIGKTDAIYSSILHLSPVLIVPDIETNKDCYTIKPDEIILDDIIDIEEGRISFNFSKTTTLYKILDSLELDVNDINLQGGLYKLQRKDDSKSNNSSFLSQWFKTVSYSDKNSKYQIIPVPDRIDGYAQEHIINSCGLKKPYLLWRSVAAVIGVEDKIDTSKLLENDEILVVDYFEKSRTISRISVRYHEGDFIPGHHIYTDSDTEVTTDYYEENDLRSRYCYSIRDSIPFVISNGKNTIIPGNEKKRDIPQYTSFQSSYKKHKVVIFTGDVPSDLKINTLEYLSYHLSCNDRNIWTVGRNIQIIKSDEEAISLGCARFATRMSNNIISYYDECEELSLVVQNQDEEILFKTLIKHQDNLIGGLKIEGDEVSGIKMQGGNSSVKFYLRLGETSYDKKLRKYEQEISLDNDFIDNTKDIPLTLKASLIAGQGRAKVDIKPENMNDQEMFGGTVLDWETMKVAYIENSNRPITLNYLIENMERTFPINMSDVKSIQSWSNVDIKKINAYLHSDIEDSDFLDIAKKLSLNKPKWPNRNSSTLDRFDKINFFGDDRSGDGLPLDPKTKALAVSLLKKLKNDYNNAKKYELKKELDVIARHISWTYQRTYFKDIAEKLLVEVERNPQQNLKMQYLNIFANLLLTNSQRIRFFNVFKKNLCSGNIKTTWIKAMLELFMRSTSFLDEANFSKRDYHIVISYVIKLYHDNLKEAHLNNCKVILQFLTFYLKIRRKYPSFCKKNSNDENDVLYYSKMKEIVSRNHSYKTREWASILEKYLDGKGNLDLPVDDFGDDDNE